MTGIVCCTWKWNLQGERRDNITDSTLHRYRTTYSDNGISTEDIFYYVYGVLHSPQYKQRYAADLSKMLPRIPQVKTAALFRHYSNAGRALAQLHINYESAPEYPLTEQYHSLIAEERDTTVTKMKFGGTAGNKDKSVIVYNQHLSLCGIPPQVYHYQVNGKSAVEWIMDRYQITTDTKRGSGIVNNPNEWSTDPHYIIKLLKKVVHISVESVKIVEGLPELGV